jgi:hypothetical protein
MISGLAPRELGDRLRAATSAGGVWVIQSDRNVLELGSSEHFEDLQVAQAAFAAK